MSRERLSNKRAHNMIEAPALYYDIIVLGGAVPS